MEKHTPSLSAKIIRKSNAVFNDKLGAYQREGHKGNVRQQLIPMGWEDLQTCPSKTFVDRHTGNMWTVPAKTIKRPIYKLILHKA